MGHFGSEILSHEQHLVQPFVVKAAGKAEDALDARVVPPTSPTERSYSVCAVVKIVARVTRQPVSVTDAPR